MTNPIISIFNFLSRKQTAPRTGELAQLADECAKLQQITESLKLELLNEKSNISLLQQTVSELSKDKAKLKHSLYKERKMSGRPNTWRGKPYAVA